MTEIQAREDGYITLKDAAALSGYAPDYIGQLIRKGKLPGKQVYSNIAWMTTEESLRAYMDEAKEAKRGRVAKQDDNILSLLRRKLTRLKGELQAVTVFKSALYFLIVMAALFAIFLFFVFAVAFDSWLTRQAAERPVDVFDLPPLGEQVPL